MTQKPSLDLTWKSRAHDGGKDWEGGRPSSSWITQGLGSNRDESMLGGRGTGFALRSVSDFGRASPFCEPQFPNL